jgi:hypothetical protein
MTDLLPGDVIYENPLASEADVACFRLEGEALVTFPNGRMRMENALSAELGQKSNFVYWCPEELPADIQVTWDFWPLREPGLCILFFAARGRGSVAGEQHSIFHPGLAVRTGEYKPVPPW